MTVTANNPSLYNAAYAGALAGLLAGAGLTGIPAIDNAANPNVYDAASNVASDFAFQFDQVAYTSAVTNVSSGHATEAPASGTIQSTQLAYNFAVGLLSFGLFFGRKGADLVDTGGHPTDWASIASALAAMLSTVTAAATASGTLV